MSTFDTLLDYFSKIYGLLGPVVLAILAWRINRSDKKDERKYNEKLKREEQEEAEKKAKEEEYIKSLELAKNAINDSVRRFEEQTKLLDKLSNKVSEISKSNKLNGQYIMKLSNLVIVLAEGLKDNHLDGNITEATSEFRKFESSMVETIIMGDDDD